MNLHQFGPGGVCCEMSIFERYFPPDSLENNSSTLGRGYESICDGWLMVTLKFPQILTEPSCFSTGQ